MPNIDFKSPQVNTFHTTGYGWNYFTQTTKDGSKFRTGRYHTNGRVNENTQTTAWETGLAPTCQNSAQIHFESNF